MTARDPRSGAPPFIVDMGRSVPVKVEGGESFTLERYAAWVFDERRGRHQVREVSDDLERLKHRYPGAPIVKVANLARDPRPRRRAASRRSR